jgi:hypothetical protein
MFKELAVLGRQKVESDLKHDVQLSISMDLEKREQPPEKKSLDYELIDQKTENLYINTMAQRTANDVKDLSEEDKKVLYIRARRDVFYEEFVKNPDAFTLDDKINALAMCRNDMTNPAFRDDALRRIFEGLLLQSIAKDFGMDIEPEKEKLSDSELRDKTDLFKKELENGIDDILPEAFAVVREASTKYTEIDNLDSKIKAKREELIEKKNTSYERLNIRNNYSQMYMEAENAIDYITIASRGLDDIDRAKQMKCLSKLISVAEKSGKSSEIDYDSDVEKFERFTNIKDIAILVKKDTSKLSDKDLLKLCIYLSDMKTDTMEQSKLRNLVAAKIHEKNPDLIRRERTSLRY